MKQLVRSTSKSGNHASAELFALKPLLMLAFLTLLVLSPFARSAGRNPNPEVIPATATYRGLSYGEWGAEWWKALFSNPVVNGDHPYLSGGAFGGDKGVVFLTALSGGATIDVTIPAGAAVFVPVMNAECSVFEPDPFHGDDETELRACANGHIDNTSGLFAVLDGVPVQDLNAYRVDSPLFEFTLPEDNLFEFFGLDAPAGTTSLAVDAGVYLLLAPLQPGVHSCHVGGTFDQLGFSIDTTFHITVE